MDHLSLNSYTPWCSKSSFIYLEPNSVLKTKSPLSKMVIGQCCSQVLSLPPSRKDLGCSWSCVSQNLGDYKKQIEKGLGSGAISFSGLTGWVRGNFFKKALAICSSHWYNWIALMTKLSRGLIHTYSLVCIGTRPAATTVPSSGRKKEDPGNEVDYLVPRPHKCILLSNQHDIVHNNCSCVVTKNYNFLTILTDTIT